MTPDPEQPEYAPTKAARRGIARSDFLTACLCDNLMNGLPMFAGFTAPPGASATTSLAGDGEGKEFRNDHHG